MKTETSQTFPYIHSQMTTFSAKVVMITGGAGAFGKAFAEAFLKNDCKVLLCDVNEEAGSEAIQNFKKSFPGCNAKFTKCDVTCDESFKAAFDECITAFGKVEILINNAGSANEKDFQTCINVNMGGVIRGTSLALDYMGKDKGHDGGHVVNIASLAGVNAYPFIPTYSGTKSGIVHYTRCIGHPFNLSYTGITVQCLCPSLTNTPFIVVKSENHLNARCSEATKKRFETFSLLETKEISDALLLLMEEKKPGAVMVIEKDIKPYYVDLPAQ